MFWCYNYLLNIAIISKLNDFTYIPISRFVSSGVVFIHIGSKHNMGIYSESIHLFSYISSLRRTGECEMKLEDTIKREKFGSTDIGRVNKYFSGRLRSDSKTQSIYLISVGNIVQIGFGFIPFPGKIDTVDSVDAVDTKTVFITFR